MTRALAAGPALTALAVLAADVARSQSCTYVAEGAAWLWHEEPSPAGWTLPSLDDVPERTTWRVGCTPFSSTGCGFAPGTAWTPSTILDLRQHVWLDGGESGLAASIAIDNDFELYVNGTLVSRLQKEGCATRWDAVVPIPDVLWVAGDNVLAVRIIDRGGIANFEMTLTGPEPPGGCPLGCATMACQPGPSVVAPDLIDCDGRSLLVAVAGAWTGPCPGELWYRFTAPDGTLLRDWGPAWYVPAQVGVDDAIVARARCFHSGACPTGTATATLSPLPYPPADPGPALRVRKVAGLAALDWSLAPPLLAGEHDHVWASPSPSVGFGRVNNEAETSRSWTDPIPGGRAHYRVRVADSCELESLDAP